MKVKYIGSLSTGVVQEGETSQEYAFKKAVPIDVSDSFGEQLLSTGVWKKASSEKKKEGGN